MPADFSAFDLAIRTIRDPWNVYIIPTFQRPYSWGEVQIRELLRDLTAASREHPPRHYLSPVHVAKLTTREDTLWQRYTDANDKDSDVRSLADNHFCDDNGNPLTIYLVIDGQQRLTTLFALYAGFTSGLDITI